MREITDKDTIELQFNVSGDFTEFEAEDLKQFIYHNVIGKSNDYKGLMERFCKEKGYSIFYVGRTIHIVKV